MSILVKNGTAFVDGAFARADVRIRDGKIAEVGALSLGRLLPCVQAGEEAAAAELDRALEALGMAHCRVLPFRRSM